MSKNIILLSDGTGNANIKDRGTNVFRHYEAIDLNRLDPDNPKEQVAFYDDGVGTEDFKPLKFLGGAFGWGLARNVRALYTHLVQIYNPGDKIYLFGFSRGAFTVRTLAGLIARKGILDISHYPDDAHLEMAVIQLYESYRDQNSAVLEKMFYRPFIKLLYKTCNVQPIIVLKGENVKIEFIGVWDTVDAVGLPCEEATEIWNKFVFRTKFSDYILHPNVLKAYHALSINDERQCFHPLVWENHPRIEQVWFPGVHANVGGGYPQQGLSLVALDWMMEKARIAGLQFVQSDCEYVRDRKYAFDKLYDSRSGLAAFYRYLPRDIKKICADNSISTPQIHISTFQRIAQGIFGYAPGNIPDYFIVVNNSGEHPHSKEIQKLVNSAYTDNPDLPSQIKHYIRLRRSIYYSFLAYAVFTLYMLTSNETNQGGLFAAIKSLVDPDSLLDMLAVLFWHKPLLAGGGLLILGFAAYARISMSMVFSKFWSPLRAQLKPLVD